MTITGAEMIDDVLNRLPMLRMALPLISLEQICSARTAERCNAAAHNKDARPEPMPLTSGTVSVPMKSCRRSVPAEWERCIAQSIPS
jgi:hypothetical protein